MCVSRIGIAAIVITLSFSACSSISRQDVDELTAENIVLITLDGLRWQEVFTGLDLSLARSEEFSAQSEKLLAEYWDDSPSERAHKLMPYLTTELFEQGTIVGDRQRSSCAEVANDWYFSYPGYSEILTGIVNPSINSNSKVPNPEKSFLELLNNDSKYQGKTAAFASWDVFPFIFNVKRSGIHVNAFSAEPDPKNEKEKLLNEIIEDTPPQWPTVRNDAFTHHYALSYLEREQPKVLFISYGETDDFAHDGKYDEYIFAAHRTDRFIQEVWEKVQSMDNYRDNTILFITVDHGRGTEPLEAWKHHASKTSLSGYMSSLSHFENGIVGSNEVWMAAVGPGVGVHREIETAGNCLTSDRIASTLIELLGLDYKEFNSDMGEPMKEFFQ